MGGLTSRAQQSQNLWCQAKKHMACLPFQSVEGTDGQRGEISERRGEVLLILHFCLVSSNGLATMFIQTFHINLECFMISNYSQLTSRRVILIYLAIGSLQVGGLEHRIVNTLFNGSFKGQMDNRIIFLEQNSLDIGFPCCPSQCVR